MGTGMESPDRERPATQTEHDCPVCRDGMLGLDAVADPVIVLGMGTDFALGTMVTVNRAARSILPESPLPDFPFTSNTADCVLCALHDLASLGGLHFDAELKGKASPVPVEVNASVAAHGAGEVAVLSCRVLTPRRQTKDALGIAESNYRQLFDQAVKGIFQTTLEGRFIRANQALADLLGYDSPQQLTLEMTNFARQLYWNPLDRERYLSLLNTHGEVTRFEVRFRHRDGSPRWVALSSRLIRGESGYDSYIEGFCSDITAVKSIENSLRESEELYRLVLSNLTDTVFITDDDGGFTYVSPNASYIFKRTPEEIHALGNVDTLLGVQLQLEQDPDGDELFNDLMEVRMPNGKRRILLITVHQVNIQGGTHLFSCRDMTEKVNLQAEAIRAAQLASLGELAAGVAHEINNPINGIILYAELLEEEAPDLGEHADVPASIIRQGERVAAISRKLLSFARTPDKSYSAVDAVAILDDSLSISSSRMVRDGISIEVDVPPSGVPYVRGRDQEVQQVFVNILSNARDALNERFSQGHKNKRLVISMRLKQMHDGAKLMASFTDSGSGIPNELQKRVFDPFFSTKPKNIGTGLGLSTTHRIIADMGGRLDLKSKAGHGTTVSVEFPLWEDE